jgi:hypothetical protein
MKKLLTLCALLCVAALPAIASAVEPTRADFRSAAKYCKAYKANAGVNNFVSVFGPRKNAYGKCVSRTANATATENAAQLKTAQSEAKQQCKREQADPNFASTHGDQTFNAYYGTNDNDKNAYGKCRSKLAHDLKAAADAQDKVEAADDVEAANTCRQEKADAAKFATDRADHGTNDFAHYYGTARTNYKNAFGKCVSRTSRELDQQEQAQQS